VVGEPTATELGEQETAVDEVGNVTVSEKVPELTPLLVSPEYEAVIV
jgi:hypothetical protein